MRLWLKDIRLSPPSLPSCFPRAINLHVFPSLWTNLKKKTLKFGGKISESFPCVFVSLSADSFGAAFQRHVSPQAVLRLLLPASHRMLEDFTFKINDFRMCLKKLIKVPNFDHYSFLRAVYVAKHCCFN